MHTYIRMRGGFVGQYEAGKIGLQESVEIPIGWPKEEGKQEKTTSSFISRRVRVVIFSVGIAMQWISESETRQRTKEERQRQPKQRLCTLGESRIFVSFLHESRKR